MVLIYIIALQTENSGEGICTPDQLKRWWVGIGGILQTKKPDMWKQQSVLDPFPVFKNLDIQHSQFTIMGRHTLSPSPSHFKIVWPASNVHTFAAPSSVLRLTACITVQPGESVAGERCATNRFVQYTHKWKLFFRGNPHASFLWAQLPRLKKHVRTSNEREREPNMDIRMQETTQLNVGFDGRVQI